MQNVQMTDGGGSGSVVGINYDVIEQGIKKYEALKGDMADHLKKMRSLKANPPQDWTGKDAELLDRIMEDAEKGLATIDSNILNVKDWMKFSKLSHEDNEQVNASTLIKAYKDIVKV